MTRWYLVHTKRFGEVVAEQNLARQGYEVYLPRLPRFIWKRGLWRERIAPLFPRYLFLRLNEDCQSLGPVGSSAGVSSVVRFGKDYAIVPDGVVSCLRARGGAESDLREVQPPRLRPGTRMRIEAGPFAGLDAIFEREDGAERVVLLLSMLGREAQVRVPTRLVAAQGALQAVPC